MKYYDVQQNTDEWEALRIGKATNSNAGTWMANLGKDFGEPAKRYALQVALEIATGRKAEHGFSNEHTERGHEQEPVARMLYEEQTFCKVSNGGFFCWGRYGDSPDGLVGNDVVVEIKSVIPSVHYATMRRGSFDPAYKWQLVGHLDCTKRKRCDFVSYCSDFPPEKRLLVFSLFRDQYLSEIAALRDRRGAFLQLVESTVLELAA